MPNEEYSKATIRAVKVLKGELKEQAEKLNLSQDAIVIVKKSEYHSEPNYKIEEIKGSIIEYLKENGLTIESE